MWRRYSIMVLVWLSLAQLVVVVAIVYALDPTAFADVDVGENICFPVHWCVPGTIGKMDILGKTV